MSTSTTIGAVKVIQEFLAKRSACISARGHETHAQILYSTNMIG